MEHAQWVQEQSGNGSSVWESIALWRQWQAAYYLFSAEKNDANRPFPLSIHTANESREGLVISAQCENLPHSIAYTELLNIKQMVNYF